MIIIEDQERAVSEILDNAMRREEDPVVYDAAAEYLEQAKRTIDADPGHFSVMVASFMDGYRAARNE